MTTATYCARCRIGRLDEDGICPLCGGIGAHVGRRKRWAFTLGRLLGNINTGLVVLGVFLVSTALFIWATAAWPGLATPEGTQVPAGVSELVAKSRSDPGGLLLELIWRALAQATVVTAIIIAVGYLLWKRQQRQAKAGNVNGDDQR